MPKPTKGPRLGGSPTHERIILRNLATQLFEHGRITTTEAKARRVQPFAEKLITKAKRGDLHSRRLVLQSVNDVDVVHKLFTEIAPSLADREGGCTRVTKLGPRKGDNAPMAVIEIVTESVEESRATRAKSPRATARPTQATTKPAKGAGGAQATEKTEEETVETPDTVETAADEVAADVQPEAAESEMIDESGAPEAAAADEIADDARVDEAADVAAPAAEVTPDEDGEPTADADETDKA